MQGIRHTNGSQARMEPYKVLSVVSSDVDILVVHGDEGSHEEISEGISTVPGRNRTGSLQETSADPSKCDYDQIVKESVGCPEIIPKQENRYWRRTWRRT